MMLYVHFTSENHARKIVEERTLLCCSYFDTVFAAPVGGKYIPGVQQTKTGRPSDRNFAVFFHCTIAPDGLCIEEATWRLPLLELESCMMITAEEAVTLLDNSLPHDEWGVVKQ